jgi:hypothetical protein
VSQGRAILHEEVDQWSEKQISEGLMPAPLERGVVECTQNGPDVISQLPLLRKSIAGGCFCLYSSCTDKLRRHMSVNCHRECLFLVAFARKHASLHGVLGDLSDPCQRD